MKGGNMVRYYFARVLAHFCALMLVPALWWYTPKVLLAIIRMNTAAMNWVIHLGVGFIPDPTAQHYAIRILQIGDTVSRMLRAGLALVPVEYRDQVEVLARVRYEPGGWLMIGQITTVFFITWLCLRRRPEKNIRKEMISRIEPILDPRPTRLPRAGGWPSKQ